MYNIFLLKKEKKLIGGKVILKKPKKENWKEWTELRQRSRNFLQPWEPEWPSNFLTKESCLLSLFFLLSDIQINNSSGDKKNLSIICKQLAIELPIDKINK